MDVCLYFCTATPRYTGARRSHALRHCRRAASSWAAANSSRAFCGPPPPPQFYLVFALASMYIAMLMTGWGSQAWEAKVSCHARPATRPPAPAAWPAAEARLGATRCSASTECLQALCCRSADLAAPRLAPTPALLLQYLINVGWTSVWVKVASQWVTVGLYCWTLVAPLLFPDRDFSA